MRGTPGSCWSSQRRHCASGCGCEITRFTSSIRPLFESSAFDTRSTRSAHTVTSRSPNESSVCVTTPSVVFSTGTIPSWVRPDSTDANTSEMLATPHSTASEPKCSRAAWCENVPSGPR